MPNERARLWQLPFAGRVRDDGGAVARGDVPGGEPEAVARPQRHLLVRLSERDRHDLLMRPVRGEDRYRDGNEDGVGAEERGESEARRGGGGGAGPVCASARALSRRARRARARRVRAGTRSSRHRVHRRCARRSPRSRIPPERGRRVRARARPADPAARRRTTRRHPRGRRGSTSPGTRWSDQAVPRSGIRKASATVCNASNPADPA